MRQGRPVVEDRKPGLILVIGILISGGLALLGYRFGEDEVMALGIVGIVLLAIWAFARPRGPADGADMGGEGLGGSGGFGDGGGGDGGGGE